MPTYSINSVKLSYHLVICNKNYFQIQLFQERTVHSK